MKRNQNPYGCSHGECKCQYHDLEHWRCDFTIQGSSLPCGQCAFRKSPDAHNLRDSCDHDNASSPPAASGRDLAHVSRIPNSNGGTIWCASRRKSVNLTKNTTHTETRAKISKNSGLPSVKRRPRGTHNASDSSALLTSTLHALSLCTKTIDIRNTVAHASIPAVGGSNIMLTRWLHEPMEDSPSPFTERLLIQDIHNEADKAGL